MIFQSPKLHLVYGQMNEPPGARMRVALSGLSMAEYFRDEMGQDVLLFVDNIFRFSQAGSEVSALLGRSPSAVGYQPTLSEEMGNLQERITSTKKGSITSFQAVYVPADDLTDPAPANTFAHLDSTIVLERSIAELGIYPAVDPLFRYQMPWLLRLLEKSIFKLLVVFKKYFSPTRTYRISLLFWVLMNFPLIRSKPYSVRVRFKSFFPNPSMSRKFLLAWLDSMFRLRIQSVALK